MDTLKRTFPGKRHREATPTHHFSSNPVEKQVLDRNGAMRNPFFSTAATMRSSSSSSPVLLVWMLMVAALTPTTQAIFDDFGAFFDLPGTVVQPATDPPTPPPTDPPTPPPTDPPVPSPTNSPVPPPTPFPTNSPVSPPTPFPTNSPTRTPTVVVPSTLTSFRSVFESGEDVAFTFTYGNIDSPQPDDWIGIFPSSVHPFSGQAASTFLFWCQQQAPCQQGSPPPQGQVQFGHSTVSWPLPGGEYKAYFFHGLSAATILAESNPFQIQPDMHLDLVVPAVQAAEQDIRSLIAQDEAMGPKFVRLAFHDCTRGCDGCVDMSLGDNAGLDIPINALFPIVQRHENAQLGFSRADIWALASHIAADVAQARSGTKVDFRMEFIGRRNCEDLNSQCFDMNGNQRECGPTLGPHVHIPKENTPTDELFHFFFEEFGFDVQETVALFGAHTLGSLNRLHSGFDGPNGWVRDNLMLDHDYYIELIGGTSPNAPLDELINTAPPWHRIRMNNEDLPGVPNKPAWRALPPGPTGETMEIIMLNVDMAIVRELDHTNMMPDGTVNCEFVEFFAQRENVPRCPHAERSFQFAVDYKFDNDLWLRDFNAVYKKMLNHGYPYDPFQQCPGGICVYDNVPNVSSSFSLTTTP